MNISTKNSKKNYTIQSDSRIITIKAESKAEAVEKMASIGFRDKVISVDWDQQEVLESSLISKQHPQYMFYKR